MVGVSQCTFWCSVLSDRVACGFRGGVPRRNAPSGAQCFPTSEKSTPSLRNACLNAPSGAQCFPTETERPIGHELTGLNAPSGAQCFPTFQRYRLKVHAFSSLNAPSGAQCFPTERQASLIDEARRSQCTFWCSVLSDRPTGSFHANRRAWSQCTFWCSVLSDPTSRR